MMRNNFIEEVFSKKQSDGYFLIQTQQINSTLHTYEGSVYIVGFNLPREHWSKKIENLTVGEYRELEKTCIDSNICLSELEYPPFQLGITISSIDRVMRLDRTPIWELIEKVRSGDIKNSYEEISEWCYKKEKEESNE